VRHDIDSTTTLDSAEAPGRSAGLSDGIQPSDSRTVKETLVGALFDGLDDDDREWVVDRINHYRTLAAAEQAPEGRF